MATLRLLCTTRGGRAAGGPASFRRLTGLAAERRAAPCWRDPWRCDRARLEVAARSAAIERGSERDEAVSGHILPAPPLPASPAAVAVVHAAAVNGYDASATTTAVVAAFVADSCGVHDAAPAHMDAHMDAAAAAAGHPSSSGLTSSSWEEEEEGVEGHEDHIYGSNGVSQDDIDEKVHIAMEAEMEQINQAVHTAFEAEMETLNQTVEQAVETALLDRSFDIKANLNTMIALTGVIFYWRGVWNIADSLWGTDDITSNLGSLIVGLAVILLFRILKVPLAEFW